MARDRTGGTDSYTIEISSLSGYHFKLTIKDFTDLDLANKNIEYVLEQVKGNVYATQTQPPTSDE